MNDTIKQIGTPVIDTQNVLLLTDSAVGFLTAYVILEKERDKRKNQKNLLVYFRMGTPSISCLLLAVELFIKVLLLKQGHRLSKLQTHKIYDLFKKLEPATQKHFISAVYGDGRKHWANLEKVLDYYNDKMIRFRYNDLTKSAHLTNENSDVLFDFAMIMCHYLGENIVVDDKVVNINE